MSTFINKDIACPKCGSTKKLTIISAVNALENPELKEKILKEEFFDFYCEECSYKSILMYPTIYHDPKKGYMVGLYRSGSKGSKVEAPASIKKLTKRRVKDLSELKEKILIFDNSLNDIATEMVKHSLLEILKKSLNSENIRAYFSEIKEDGSLSFAIFFGSETNPQYHGVKKEVYDNCCEILRSLNYKEPSEFLRVGPTLAAELLSKYKNN